MAVGTNPEVYGLALVDGGWTGTVALTVSAVAATVTPYARESVASLMRRLASEAERRHGYRLTAWPLANGRLVVAIDDSSATFSLSASGTCETRLGFTSPSSAAGAFTTTSAHYGGVYPETGIRLESALDRTAIGRPYADGLGGTIGLRELGRGRLSIWADYDTSWALESTIAGNTYDVWGGERLFGRVRIPADLQRSPRSDRLRTLVELSATVQGVAE